MRGVKRELMVHLISECKNRQCQDFYRQNEIRNLDLGCLHYDSVSSERETINYSNCIGSCRCSTQLPDTEDFMKGMEALSKSNFATYPEAAAKQLRTIASGIKDYLNNLLNVVREGLEKGGNPGDQS